jgi:Ca-activated chloride channel family protein
MAEALGWPDKNVSWDEVIALAADPEGWARYGHPEWGSFTFGHPHAVYSNFGMLMTAEVAHATLDHHDRLTLEQVQSESVLEAMRQLEAHTYHYGVNSRDLLNLMAAKGPSYLHAVFTAEAEVLKANADHAAALTFPLAFVFPAEGTFWTEQPYCILDGADWVTDAHREAAAIYRDYLLMRERQAEAVDYYLRPVDSTLSLDAPFTLANGTDPDVTQADVPPLPSPSGPVADALKALFLQTKKKATILLVLDTSGSMAGDKIKTATEAAANFILRLEPEDEIVVMPFSSGVHELTPSGQAREVAEGLSQQVRGLRANGGTALYDAICRAIERSAELQAGDIATQRLYGIVVLTDGLDSGSATSQQQLFDQCLPTGEDVEGVKVFTIAYGNDADKALLKQIAERANGKTFSGNPETIESVYLAISAEQ